MDIRTRMHDTFVRFDETQQRMLSARSIMLYKRREQAPDAHPATVAYYTAKGEHQAASILVDALHQQAKDNVHLIKLMRRVKIELRLVIPGRIQVLTNVVLPDTPVTPDKTAGEQK